MARIYSICTLYERDENESIEPLNITKDANDTDDVIKDRDSIVLEEVDPGNMEDYDYDDADYDSLDALEKDFNHDDELG